MYIFFFFFGLRFSNNTYTQEEIGTLIFNIHIYGGETMYLNNYLCKITIIHVYSSKIIIFLIGFLFINLFNRSGLETRTIFYIRKRRTEFVRVKYKNESWQRFPKC